MFCSKCSAEVPNGSNFCLKCGTPLAPKIAKTRRKITLPKLGLPLLPLLGAVMLIVGPLLVWVRAKQFGDLIVDHPSPSIQGLQYIQSIPLLVLGAMVFVVMVLAKGNERRLSALLTALGVMSLAFVFHFIYRFFDSYQNFYSHTWGHVDWGDVREGFYVVGVGAFLVALSGCPLFRKIVI